MSQNTAPAAHSQRPIEDILDFCVELSRRMITCGANMERVSLAVERICKTYALTDMSLFLLSTNVILSARDSSGFYASRQLTIPPAASHSSIICRFRLLRSSVPGREEGPVAGRPWRRVNQDRSAGLYADHVETDLYDHLRICGFPLCGTPCDTAEKAFYLLRLSCDHPAHSRRPVLLHAPGNLRRKQRDGHGQRLRLHILPCIHELRLCSQFRGRPLYPQI